MRQFINSTLSDFSRLRKLKNTRVVRSTSQCVTSLQWIIVLARQKASVCITDKVLHVFGPVGCSSFIYIASDEHGPNTTQMYV
jgi:hypothetical protein